MSEEVLKVLAHRTNQAILNLLAVEPTYPRKIADLLSLSETDVARRLKQMEAIGLVNGAWGRVGKNVKLYTLTTDLVSVRFTPAGMQLVMARSDGGASRTEVVSPFVESIPAPADFVGRVRELAALSGPERVAVVEGMPGVGKTTLLSAFATAQSRTRPVFWHSFRGIESLNWLANRLAIFLARQGDRGLLDAIEAGADLADKRALMLARMDQDGFVFVLDDVDRIEDEAVRSFIADAARGAKRARLVLAGRQRPKALGAVPQTRSILLAGLEDADVAAFLQHKGVSLPAELMPKVREEVGGHPLALNLFLEAAREMGVSPAQLLDRVPERNLEEWLLGEVYETLSDSERLVLAHASVFRTGFTLDALRAVTRKDPDAPLIKLRRRLLIGESGGDYALHEVIRNFFYSRLKEKAELHGRAATHYLSQGQLESRLEAMHHLLAAGRRDRVLELLEEDLDLKDFDFIDSGYQNLYMSILDLFERAEVREPKRWALIQDEKGDICFHRAEYERALKHYDEALAHFQTSSDARRLADLAWKRAMAMSRLGRGKEAASTLEAGLKAAPKEGLERQRLEELKASLVKKR